MLTTSTQVFAVLSCSVTTAATCLNTIVLRMSSSTNAHAELPWQTSPGYDNNVICCAGSLSTSCTSGFTATVVKLSSSTNAHVEIGSNTNYSTSSCISSVTEIPVIAYQDASCTGYDTTLGSMSSDTNAMIGISTAYTKKICGTLTPQSLSFAISTSTIYLGDASPSLPRYASSTNVNGSDLEVEAHTFFVVTTATNGYVVTAKGSSLYSGSRVIAAIGAVNTSSVTGTEQFGIRLNSSGGLGTVTAPYAASGFAYAGTATTSTQVASASSGNNATTTYSVRYLANIAPITNAASYSTGIIYIVTANF